MWEARDVDGRRRALKLVRPAALVAPSDLVVRGGWLRRIDDPALVRVWRTGRLPDGALAGWGFMEMDFVEGEALTTAPPDAAVLARLAGLAAALDRLHAGVWSQGQPLVHRDVKPANLIATPSGRIVLVDPSTLRSVEDAAVTRIGTPLYAAAEVLSGRIGPPADVYSFAVTIVALATGARGADLRRVLADPAALALPATVSAALRTDPARRPTSCAAVLAAGATIDLSALADLRSPEVRPPGVRASRRGASRLGIPRLGIPGLRRVGRAGVGADAATAGGDRSPSRPGLVLAGLALAGAASALAVLAATGPSPFAAFGASGTFLAVGLAAAVILGGALLAGAGPAAALFANPLAWAWAVGARSAPPGRTRAWVRTSVTGALGALLSLAALGVLEALPGTVEVALTEPDVAALGPLAGGVSALAGNLSALLTALTEPLEGAGRAGAVAALLGLAPLSAACAAVGPLRGAAGTLLRTGLAPCWLAGALVLSAAGLLLAVPAVLAGRPGAGPGLLTGTLAGALAWVAPAGTPAGARPRLPPDPRA